MNRTAGIVFALAVWVSLLPIASAAPSEVAIESSTAKLKKIHAALVAYEKKHRYWPDHLSDLVPDYLPDEAALRDEADPGTGSLGSDEAHPDPKFRVSYSYERTADKSNGLPGPLGPFPPPDVGNSWGSWRLVNGHQEYFWGDQVPLVRCYLHRPPEAERADGHDLVLNLTPSGRIYPSRFDWAAEPDSVDFMLRTFARDLRLGFANVQRHWHLGRVLEYLNSRDKLLPYQRFAAVLAELAHTLMERRSDLGEDARPACQLAALFELSLDRPERCLAALDEAAKFRGPEWAPVVDDQRRAAAYRAAKNFPLEVATYRRLLELRPGNRAYLEGLANALDSAGEKTAAAEARAKADPGAALVGKTAPDFSLTLPAGETITLERALAGKKAVLLNFWFLGCAPCRQEMPHLQALYERHRDRLGIVCVNFGDKARDISKYWEEKKFTLPWTLGQNQPGAESRIFATYHVSSYPTNYLIAADGTIRWRGIGFGAEGWRELESKLAEILK
jgi:thiol-disulfide isomerase/thioredoxin